MTTPNIVPRGNGEGGIGTNEKFWKNGYFENLYTHDGAVATENHVQLSIKNHNDATSVHTANLASKAEAEAGTDTSKFMTPARTREAMQTFVGGDLTGMIFAFAGNTIPSGFLLCDGSKVSRTTYKKLFNVIGTTYGAGDGSTTFTLPNLIDRFLEGSSAAGKYRDAGLPNITGRMGLTFGYTSNDHQTPYPIGATRVSGVFSTDEKWGRMFTPEFTNNNMDSEFIYSAGGFDASKSNSIYGASSTVQPPALTAKFLIKY